MNVDGFVSSGGLGGPAILPLSLAKMAQLTQAFPDKSFSGIGGVAEFAHALNYFLLGCGTVQVCTAAMLDHAIGPNVIKGLISGMTATMEKHGWATLDDFRGLRRDRVVTHSQIRRPDAKAYHGGYEAEGYASHGVNGGGGGKRGWFARSPPLRGGAPPGGGPGAGLAGGGGSKGGGGGATPISRKAGGKLPGFFSAGGGLKIPL